MRGHATVLVALLSRHSRLWSPPLLACPPSRLSHLKTMTQHRASSSSSPQDEVMLFKKLSPAAQLPVRGSDHAAGFDLAAAHSTVVPPGGKALVKTDLAIAIPPYTYARVAPRSGLAWKRMIATGAGVVDHDYRGNVGVVLFNHGTEPFEVQPGDRIAQLILERICMAPALEVQELPETRRGAGGFGSTGGSQALTPGATEGETTAEGEAIKRVRVQVPVEEAAVAERAQLLVFVHSLADVKGLDLSEADALRLKELALEGSVKLAAAARAYASTCDAADLASTLRLLLKPQCC